MLGAAAPSGITAQDRSQPGAPWGCVPLPSEQGGSRGSAGVSLVSPALSVLSVCLAGALGWTLLAVTQGFQTLPGFPPGGSRRWEQVSAAQGWGELCHDPGITLVSVAMKRSSQ